jgi:signal transduction histidine kinase/CheY-like chemotaxis protein
MKRFVPTNLRKNRWLLGALLFFIYGIILWASAYFIPSSTFLFPAAAVALSALFLEGLDLWPFVYLASLTVALLSSVSLIALLILPVAQTLQALAGAYILHRAKIDPLFRRSRDILYLLGAAFLVSFITPTLSLFITHSITPAAVLWSREYASTIFVLIVLTSFLLRWFAKLRFSRPIRETIETVVAFILLIGVDFFLFRVGILTLGNISLVFFLLAPLFWIALRLRPRFVTLALLLTSLAALVNLFAGPLPIGTELFAEKLFQTEIFLIILSTMFLIIVALEENRRLNTNIMLSQMGSLENALARISSESQAKNDFIAVLAHELRNPLAPVVSAIDFFKLKGGRPQEELELFDMMEERMLMVRRLLDDLLDVSRVSEGKIALRKETVNLEETLRRSIISTAHYFKERHQPLTVKIAEKALFVEGDALRLEQVFSNLLTNASKYSASGDEITLSLKRVEDEAEIIIRDQGIGIAPEAVEDIFMPFHQVGAEKVTRKGLGIGLALVRGFVELHKGRISVKSEGPGMGSEFIVQLPLLREAAREISTAAEFSKKQHVPEPAQRTGRSARILVVDDNDAAAWGVGRLLDVWGFSVEYAYDGRQAIEKSMSMRPDIIFLDLDLPDQDGYTVAKTIRARGFHGKLIALTGFNPNLSQLERISGFENYLVKPVGFAELKRALPDLL